MCREQPLLCEFHCVHGVLSGYTFFKMILIFSIISLQRVAGSEWRRIHEKSIVNNEWLFCSASASITARQFPTFAS